MSPAGGARPTRAAGSGGSRLRHAGVRLSAARLTALQALADAKRAEHPELTAPSWDAVLAVLEREYISLSLYDLGRHGNVGSTLVMDGIAVIQIHERLGPDDRCVVALHELAHVWLHGDDAVRLLRKRLFREDRAAFLRLDARMEAEADRVAALLLGVPFRAYRRRLAALLAWAETEDGGMVA